MQTAGKLMKVFVTRRIPPEGMKILSAGGVYAFLFTIANAAFTHSLLSFHI